MEKDKIIDYKNLPLEDLQEEYGNLWERYVRMQDKSDDDTQRIYELKRGLEVANAAQAYLSQELEQLSCNSGVTDNLEKESNKLHADYDELKRKYNKLDIEYITLQQDHDTLQEECNDIRKKLEHFENNRNDDGFRAVTPTYESTLERLTTLELENNELLERLQEYQDEITKQTMSLASQEKNIELLQEHVKCLEENVQSKREEIEEKTNLLESAQEQVAEITAKLSTAMSAPDNANRKGNSLFAEVDDQRQKMRKILQEQKRHYVEMKKAFNESEYEIRRLKRENNAMHTELQAVTSIFCNADKTYHVKLNERLRQLHNQNDELERKLSFTQNSLKDVANEHGAKWLESLLKFCKKETEDLKQQLSSVRVQKASVEEQLRKMQQDMARWRFETLRLRCILLNREDLLNENKIAFKAIPAYEVHVSDEELSQARPRIVPPEGVLNKRHSLNNSARINDNAGKVTSESCEVSKVSSCETPQASKCETAKTWSVDETTDPLRPMTTASTTTMTTTTTANESSVICIDTPIKTFEINDDKENSLSETKMKMKFCKTPKLKLKQYPNRLPGPNESQCEEDGGASQLEAVTGNARNNAVINPITTNITDNSEITSPVMKNSILCKRRDIFADLNNEKIVTFAKQEATIHNITPPELMDDKDVDVKKEAHTTGITQCESFTLASKHGFAKKVQTIRTKSNVVITRVCVEPTKREPPSKEKN